MWLSDIHTSVGPWFRQSLYQYVLEAENTNWELVSLLDMFPRNLLQLALLHTVPAQSLGLTQVKALIYRGSLQSHKCNRQQAVYFDCSLAHKIWKVGIHTLPEEAQGRVIPLPPGSTNCCRGTGGSTYQGFFSSRRSGTTFTKAMYRNPPEVKGRIQATVSPAQIQKASVITETELWDTTQKGKKIQKDDKQYLLPHF